MQDPLGAGHWATALVLAALQLYLPSCSSLILSLKPWTNFRLTDSTEREREYIRQIEKLRARKNRISININQNIMQCFDQRMSDKNSCHCLSQHFVVNIPQHVPDIPYAHEVSQVFWQSGFLDAQPGWQLLQWVAQRNDLSSLSQWPNFELLNK